MTLLLTRSDTQGLGDLERTIEAVGAAFAAHGRGGVLDPQRVHVAADGGGFHVVVGGVRHAEGGSTFVAKINASFEPGPGMGGLRLVGLIVLSDAQTGEPLAVMDSATVTTARTAAATGVALAQLARPQSTTLVLVGAGRQAALQVQAARQVLPELSQVLVWSPTAERREQTAAALVDAALADAALADAALADAAPASKARAALAVEATGDLDGAVQRADAIVTVTPARGPLFAADLVGAGTTIVALGSDGPGKQELDPVLLGAARSRVVTDVTTQCLASGETGHAVRAGILAAEDVHAELGQVVAGARPGRTHDDEIIVFDSTGTAMQDVAGALVVYERALAERRGVEIDFTA